MAKEVEVKQNLFEIVAQAQVIEKMLAESGGELSPELEQALMNVDISLTTKVEGYSHIMEKLDHDSKYWKAKASEYAAIGKAMENVVSKIKERLKFAMIELKKEEIFGESIRFTLIPTKGSLVIEDESKLTDEFLMIETRKIPDKEKIRAALESFAEVPGAKMAGGYQMRKYAIKASK